MAAAPLVLAAKVREVVARQVDLDAVADGVAVALGSADLEAELFFGFRVFCFFSGFFVFWSRGEYKRFFLVAEFFGSSSPLSVSLFSNFSLFSLFSHFISPVYSSKIRSSGTLSHEEEEEGAEAAPPPQRRAARASSGEDDFFSPLLPSPLAR